MNNLTSGHISVIEILYKIHCTDTPDTHVEEEDLESDHTELYSNFRNDSIGTPLLHLQTLGYNGNGHSHHNCADNTNNNNNADGDDMNISQLSDVSTYTSKEFFYGIIKCVSYIISNTPSSIQDEINKLNKWQCRQSILINYNHSNSSNNRDNDGMQYTGNNNNTINNNCNEVTELSKKENAIDIKTTFVDDLDNSLDRKTHNEINENSIVYNNSLVANIEYEETINTDRNIITSSQKKSKGERNVCMTIQPKEVLSIYYM